MNAMTLKLMSLNDESLDKERAVQHGSGDFKTINALPLELRALEEECDKERSIQYGNRDFDNSQSLD